MKMLVDRNAVMALLPPLVKVCSRRSPRPQLSCVHLQAEKGKLRLTATDCECWISRETDAVDVQVLGEALVSAYDLSAALGACAGAPVIELDGDTLFVRGDHQTFKLMGYPAKDFPPAPEMVEGEDIPAASLRFALAATAWALSNTITRYATTGYGLIGDGKRLDVVTTDGTRMAVASTKHPKKLSVILPPNAAALLLSLLGECEEEGESVTIGATSERVCVAASGWSLSSCVMEGTFPPYLEAIPKDEPKLSATIDREAFVAAIQAASLTAGDDPVMQLRFKPADKSLRVGTRTPERGQSLVVCDLSAATGDKEMTVGYRPKYLLGALGPCQNPEVVFNISKPTGPATIREGDYLAIVMPRANDHVIEDEDEVLPLPTRGAGR